MKKSIAFVLLIAFIIPIFSACKGEQTDIWDGSIATSFESGDGSESAPYEIKTCAQLAYLAQQINTGVSYTGKSFSLTSNLDLNNISWTPIGNGIYAFDGNFNGNGYTVSNMNIDTLTVFDKVYSHTTTKEAVAGLFGYCTDATISNLNINDSQMLVSNIGGFDQIHTGFLVGYTQIDSLCKFQSIKIDNSIVSVKKTEEYGKTANSMLHTAGLVGYIYVAQGADCKLDLIDVNIQASIEEKADTSYVGGICGIAFCENSSLDCSNFISYLDVNWQTDFKDNAAGAFGGTGILNSYMKLNNGFSEVNTNKKSTEVEYTYSYGANAIVGKLHHTKNQDRTVSGQYEFSNLYGCVKPLEGADFEAPILSLYLMPAHAIYTEDNCYGALTPPEGFNMLPN
ncbi:MAG: hypothetical protein IKA74_01540 [Clostridia bacterium]|nr:hypothetical protein [Clostridia bacterium]